MTCNVSSGTLNQTMSMSRVRTDIKILFSRTFQDLQRPNSRVFQDSKIFFQGLSRIHSVHKHGLHEFKKCTYQISYQCICSIKVFLILDLTQEVAMYYNEFLIYLAITQTKN